MPRRIPLPDPLGATPSRVGPGAALRDYAPRLRPGDRFSHTSAAILWAAPLPHDAARDLHITAGAGLASPRSRGVVGHRGGASTPVLRSGLPASGALRTFCELAQLLRIDDLVAVGDHLVLDPHVADPEELRPHLTLDALRDGVGRARGRGVRLARKAADLVRCGAESPRETFLRLLLARAGFRDPVCGYRLRDAGGRIVGRFTLAWPEHKVIVEYDGDRHDAVRNDEDTTRFDGATALGWRMIRVRDSGLVLRPGTTITRIAEALRRDG